MRDWTGFEFIDQKTGDYRRIVGISERTWTGHRFEGGAKLSRGWATYKLVGGEWEVDYCSFDDSVLQQIAERQRMNAEACYLSSDFMQAVDDPRIEWPEWGKYRDAGLSLGW
jgi:hypothetical protein